MDRIGIRDNIEAFNGDPNKGASDTSLLLRAFDGVQGVPFQRAMRLLALPVHHSARAFSTRPFTGTFLRRRPSQLMRAGKFVKGFPANDGAWYAAPPTSTDEVVLNSFELWLFGLSDFTKEKLLEFYPLVDFEHMVRREYDGPISAQYYRTSQMNRDLGLVCPVLNFPWQYIRSGGVEPL
ncbi:uncharacterized protein ATNIH1004_008566 [Aspergillus tanneri]|uniref:Uncharacterized protein n=1 Tax=Aspergillus tanneri TaxID=1220188 RepID=A0A5M9MBB8_9EURO|nr:uncharacterized protein ATNIH1004_008566 [Aspergillus tanneri]KAA8644365.1 hypothetical protein ATNIH1004_008566 [Aspergillus tanneri]